jgi:hypothetical protein
MRLSFWPSEYIDLIESNPMEAHHMEELRRYFGHSTEKWNKMTDNERKQAAEDFERDRKTNRFAQKWEVRPIQEETA